MRGDVRIFRSLPHPEFFEDMVCSVNLLRDPENVTEDNSERDQSKVYSIFAEKPTGEKHETREVKQKTRTNGVKREMIERNQMKHSPMNHQVFLLNPAELSAETELPSRE
jgi:hypothetical protein